jgi:outer membrane immunogenic protein
MAAGEAAIKSGVAAILLIVGLTIPSARADGAWARRTVGINFGYSSAQWDTSSVASIFPGIPGTVATPMVNGPLAGLQAGYNALIDRRWVFGFEADIQITAERDKSEFNSSTNALCCDNEGSITTTDMRLSRWEFLWFATLRARGGWLIDPETLLHVTGGLAIGGFKFSLQSSTTTQPFNVAGTVPAGPVVLVASSQLVGDTVQPGWVAGMGINKKLGPRWFARLEYLYLDFGTHTFLAGTGSDTSVHLSDHVVRVALSYRLDDPDGGER